MKRTDKPCECCGRMMKNVWSRTKYCPTCAKEKEREWKRRRKYRHLEIWQDGKDAKNCPQRRLRLYGTTLYQYFPYLEFLLMRRKYCDQIEIFFLLL